MEVIGRGELGEFKKLHGEVPVQETAYNYLTSWFSYFPFTYTCSPFTRSDSPVAFAIVQFERELRPEDELIGSRTINANNFKTISSFGFLTLARVDSLTGLGFRLKECRMPLKRLVDVIYFNFLIRFNPFIGVGVGVFRITGVDDDLR